MTLSVSLSEKEISLPLPIQTTLVTSISRAVEPVNMQPSGTQWKFPEAHPDRDICQVIQEINMNIFKIGIF